MSIFTKLEKTDIIYSMVGKKRKQKGLFHIQIMNGYSNVSYVYVLLRAPMLCRHVYIFHYLINSLLGVNAIKACHIKDVLV